MQLREIKLSGDGKPVKDDFTDGSSAIRRKPYINMYSQQWQVCGDYDRVLRKYVEEEVTSE